MNKVNQYGNVSREEQNLSERRRDHLVFFICLILAASFWFLIKLSDVYPVSYTLKIRYTQVPTGHLITALQDSSVTIHFKSNGYNLLDLLLHRQLDSLKINLSQCDIRKEQGKKYVVNTSSLREITAQNLGVNDHDLEFSKPRLYFFMERLHEARIPVVADMDLHFESQFRLYDYQVKPQKVKVFGPQNLLDTIKVIHTQTIHFEELQSPQTVKVALNNPNPKMLKIYPARVRVNLDVQKYTEKSLQVPVDVSDIAPPIRTFPTTVTVTFNVFIRDYEKVSPSQFKVVPNVKNINLNKVKKLRLQIISSPKIVNNIRIVPPEVEFIIIN